MDECETRVSGSCQPQMSNKTLICGTYNTGKIAPKIFYRKEEHLPSARSPIILGTFGEVRIQLVAQKTTLSTICYKYSTTWISKKIDFWKTTIPLQWQRMRRNWRYLRSSPYRLVLPRPAVTSICFAHGQWGSKQNVRFGLDTEIQCLFLAKQWNLAFSMELFRAPGFCLK